MSFEQVIAEHTVALREHAAALVAFIEHKAAPTGILSDKERARMKEIGEVPMKEVAAKAAQTTKKEPEQTTAAIVKAETPVEAPTDVVDYETLKTVVLAVAKKDRKEAVALLERFGATKISELKTDSYNDAYDLAQQIVARTASALSSNDESLA